MRVLNQNFWEYSWNSSNIFIKTSVVFSLNPPCLSVGKNYLDCTTKMNVIEEQSLTNKYFLWQGLRNFDQEKKRMAIIVL